MAQQFEHDEWSPPPGAENMHKANGHGQSAPILKRVDLGVALTPRRYTITPVMPRRSVGLLSGEGAVGKSILLLQLAVAHVLGRDWISYVCEPGPVMILSCEDSEDEIRRRLEPIAKHYEVDRGRLDDLHIFDMAGSDATLGQVNKRDAIEPTELYQSLYAEAKRIEPICIIIDTVADTFGGNENNRLHVRQFIGLMRRLALDHDCAVLLAAHPSQYGIRSDTGTSGTTAWHNSVRARAYLRYPKSSKDEDLVDTNVRDLEWHKIQYGAPMPAVSLRWNAGWFGVEAKQTMDRVARAAEIEQIVLAFVRNANFAGTNLYPHNQNGGAAHTISKCGDAKTIKAKSAEIQAVIMDLIKRNKVKVVEVKHPRGGTRKVLEIGEGFEPQSEFGQHMREEDSDDYRF